MLAYVRPHRMKDLNQPYRLISLEDNRYKLCHIKTLNLIPSVLASQRAAERGCDEAVLHRGSRVTRVRPQQYLHAEGRSAAHRPHRRAHLPARPGSICALAKENGVPVVEEPFSMVELMNADEAIVTSSSALCMGVESIDGIPVGGRDRERFHLLQSACMEEFQRETKAR